MSCAEADEEPTHHISKELEQKLVEAKEWYDRRARLEFVIRTYGGSAQRNQEDRDESDREGASLLTEIVEIVDETWGFEKPLREAGE
jgi:hypothetical protein